MTTLVLASLIGAAFALIYQLRFVTSAVSVPRSLIKTLSILALAIGVIILTPSLYNTDVLIESRSLNPMFFVFVALVFSALGDFFLSRDGQMVFFAGILAFSLAQLFYVITMIYGVPDANYPPHWFRFALMVLAAIGFFLIPHDMPLYLRIAILSYGCVLLTMTWFAVLSGSWLLGLGAVLFVLSDLMIGLGLDDRLSDKLGPKLSQGVWLTYWPAQALLVWGFYFVL